ncbi:MAG: AAA family ATPase [Deltaproteobacteria bacterium]|nr:AAA family ATPase [Deltaproteobacteria bacterium]
MTDDLHDAPEPSSHDLPAREAPREEEADGAPLRSKHVTREKSPPVTDLESAFNVFARMRERLRAAVKGRDDVIDLILVAVLADGHVLLEDFPGSGKTTLAKALGDCIVDDEPDDAIVTIRRIQFTPDLLPSDVTGTTIFDPNTNRFFFRPGPLFAHVVLADEINRTSPKVQSALLEAMAEKQVTVDNRTRPLDELFLVIATQNPLDVAGTFPLPNAQLDRFLFKIRMTHIAPQHELELLRSFRDLKRLGDRPELPRVTRSEILDARVVMSRAVYVDEKIHQTLVGIASRTRADERILQGASTRSLVLALPALQARALLARRNYVTAEDVDALAVQIFTHRLEFAPGVTEPDTVVRQLTGMELERLARGSV